MATVLLKTETDFSMPTLASAIKPPKKEYGTHLNLLLKFWEITDQQTCGH
jgi:hypothetical protein